MFSSMKIGKFKRKHLRGFLKELEAKYGLNLCWHFLLDISLLAQVSKTNHILNLLNFYFWYWGWLVQGSRCQTSTIITVRNIPEYVQGTFFAFRLIKFSKGLFCDDHYLGCASLPEERKYCHVSEKYITTFNYPS